MKLDASELKRRWEPMQRHALELRKRLQARTVLAVTLESHRTIIELVRREGANTTSVQTFTLALGADELVGSAEKAGAELAAQFTAARIRERRCVVCVPAGWALTTSAEIPAISGEDLRSYLELQAEREFPMAVADLRLAHCPYTLPDGKQRATLAAVPARRLEALERMLAAAGCKAVSISLGLHPLMPSTDSPAAMHFVANGTHVDLVIAAGGGIAALRSLSGSARPSEGSFDAAAFAREVRITLGGLPDAVRQQVQEARFSGGEESAESLCIEIRQHLARMGVKSRVHRGEPGADLPAVARAAAAQHLAQQPVVFEFLPPQINRWETLFARFDSSRRRWCVAAAVALLVLPVLIFFVRSRIESSLEAEWKGMSRSVEELEALQHKIRDFRPWFATTPQTVQLIDGLAAAFPESGEVWAKSIQLNEEGKVTCTGFAKSEAALGSFLERLRSRPDVSVLQRGQQRSENPIQFSVTYKWEPRDGK